MLWTVFGSESHWMYKQPLINCDMPGNIPQLTSVCFIVSFYCLGKAEGVNLDSTVGMATPLLMKSLHLLWELNCIRSGITVEKLDEIWNFCAYHWKGVGPTQEQLQNRHEYVVTVLVILDKIHCNSHGAPTSKSGFIWCQTCCLEVSQKWSPASTFGKFLKAREPSVFSPQPSQSRWSVPNYRNLKFVIERCMKSWKRKKEEKDQ